MTRLAKSGLAWGVAVSVPFVFVVLVPLGGRDYYTTPLAVRGYAAGHALLRPSGPAGQSFGMVGTLLMLMPFLYMARKRLPWLRRTGSLKTWLEIHLFCGIVGPVLITFHTSFKFNGIVSAAYWSMVAVVLSGFIGRYLYVRIPRSIRGTELTRAEIDARMDALKDELAASVPSPAALARIDWFERAVAPPERGRLWMADLVLGDIRLRRRLRALQHALDQAGLPHDLRDKTVKLAAERATLRRRIAHLQKTRTMFELWHVFHLPLVYLLLVIVAAHVAVTLYLGYVPFRW